MKWKPKQKSLPPFGIKRTKLQFAIWPETMINGDVVWLGFYYRVESCHHLKREDGIIIPYWFYLGNQLGRGLS